MGEPNSNESAMAHVGSGIVDGNGVMHGDDLILGGEMIQVNEVGHDEMIQGSEMIRGNEVKSQKLGIVIEKSGGCGGFRLSPAR
jgi:hypothetical protein